MPTAVNLGEPTRARIEAFAIARAIMDAKPGREKKARRKALKKVRRAYGA